MRSVVTAIGLFWAWIIAVLIIIAVCWLSYLAYLRFVEAPAITQHAQNVRHSLNFVQAANQRAENAIAEFTGDTASGDTAHANADRIMACSAASTIDTSEQQPDVQAFVLAHCAGQ